MQSSKSSHQDPEREQRDAEGRRLLDRLLDVHRLQNKGIAAALKQSASYTSQLMNPDVYPHRHVTPQVLARLKDLNAKCDRDASRRTADISSTPETEEAKAHFYASDYKRVIACCKNAIPTTRDPTLLHYYLGRSIHASGGCAEDALYQYQQALTLHPDFHECWYHVGVLLTPSAPPVKYGNSSMQLLFDVAMKRLRAAQTGSSLLLRA